MDSAANSRRASNCSSLDNFSDLDHCGLEAEQVRTLKRTFDQFDSDGGGSISVDTVNTILHMMGMKVSPRALEEIVHEIDEDESGTLEFPEFIQLAAKFLIEEDEEQMRWELKGRIQAFRIYDKSGDGYITVETLREILHEIDPSLSDEDLDGIIEEVDEDESGTVDFDEFMHMMTGA